MKKSKLREIIKEILNDSFIPPDKVQKIAFGEKGLYSGTIINDPKNEVIYGDIKINKLDNAGVPIKDLNFFKKEVQKKIRLLIKAISVEK